MRINLMDEINKGRFINLIDSFSNEIYSNSIRHGFWDFGTADESIIVTCKLALIHSEISEALEAIRNHNPADEHCPEFSSLTIELADAMIRIMDLAHSLDCRLGAAILAKHEYNKSRPYKHGKTI